MVSNLYEMQADLKGYSRVNRCSQYDLDRRAVTGSCNLREQLRFAHIVITRYLKSVGEGKVNPLTTPTLLNRQSPNIAYVITSTISTHVPHIAKITPGVTSTHVA